MQVCASIWIGLSAEAEQIQVVKAGAVRDSILTVACLAPTRHETPALLPWPGSMQRAAGTLLFHRR